METLDQNDDKDLELMFAEARRYPLLTAEQEREIDGRKWTSVRSLHTLFASDVELSAYCREFFTQCQSNPPEIGRFANREQHFVLRRELAAYFIDGDYSLQTKEAVRALGLKTAKTRIARMSDLNVPASLSVGMAVAMLRRAGGQFPDSVADAIATWERQWQPLFQWLST